MPKMLNKVQDAEINIKNENNDVGGRMTENRHEWKQEKFWLNKEKLFTHEDSQTAEKTAQRSCAVSGCALSILGGFQDPDE